MSGRSIVNVRLHQRRRSLSAKCDDCTLTGRPKKWHPFQLFNAI